MEGFSPDIDETPRRWQFDGIIKLQLDIVPRQSLRVREQVMCGLPDAGEEQQRVLNPRTGCV